MLNESSDKNNVSVQHKPAMHQMKTCPYCMKGRFYLVI